MISAKEAREASIKNKEFVERMFVANICSSTETVIKEAVIKGQFECPLSVWCKEKDGINPLVVGQLHESVIEGVREKFEPLGYEIVEGFIYYFVRW